MDEADRVVGIKHPNGAISNISYDKNSRWTDQLTWFTPGGMSHYLSYRYTATGNISWIFENTKVQTVRALIMSPKALNGAQLQFLRKYMKKSLRDLGEELEVSHAQIKNWEDKNFEFTGLTQNQERKLKNHVLNHLISQEQRFLYDRLLTQDIEQISDEEPFDPYKEELRYG